MVDSEIVSLTEYVQCLLLEEILVSLKCCWHVGLLHIH